MQRLKHLFLVLLIVAPSCANPRPDSGSPHVLDAAEGRVIDFPGHEMRVLLEADSLHGDVAVFEITVPPRSFGAPPHRHAHEDELFYVLEGELVFLCGEDELRCGPGATASLPRGHVHGFWNDSDAPARALLTITPARFGHFFDEVVEELRARGVTDRAAVGGVVAEVAGRYDCEVYADRVGPIAQRYGLR